MMKKLLFSGVCTALVTPFLDGKINYPMMEQLLRRQIQAGVPAVVIAGTTGEAPTLSDDEKLALFSRCKDYAGDALTVIAGTGSNSTDHAVWLSQEAEKRGVDGLLVVTPYYNKATNEGLYAHYCAVAEGVNLPVIVYNVPGRTGVDIPVEVYRRLAQIPNIAGVKEASPSISKIAKIIAACGTDLPVWTGNDDMTVPALALGGKGVVSVASNVLPEQMCAMAEAGLDGDFDTAAALQSLLLPAMEALFCEVSPIPVKAALKQQGFDCGGCRLPLTGLSKANQERIRRLF